MSRVGHGLSRVVSRVVREKRPVLIGLSRCHGSARGDAPSGLRIDCRGLIRTGRSQYIGNTLSLGSSESLLKASDESSGKMHDRALWDGRDGSWDGLGRTLGRIKHAKSSMFTGLGTVGRIN
jgi:hypothetical protein